MEKGVVAFVLGKSVDSVQSHPAFLFMLIYLLILISKLKQ